MTILHVSRDAVVIPFYVKPRASRSRFVCIHDGMVKVDLAAPPVDGAANKTLVRFVADALNTSRSSVELISGHKSRRKRLQVTTEAPEHIVEALMGLVPTS